ncbi:MAG: FMN-binding negative transcriptional regulator [Actinomycetota bacterium]|nr:FMN-binding negative transcriptional regulator [Actinomycetota bacterium]
MLIKKVDEALSEEEWKHFLRTHDFGQFIAAGEGRRWPIVVPTHFVYADDIIWFHLMRSNPVWEALSESPLGVFTVVGAYTYVTSEMNTPPGTSAEFGIPTSYYAAVQLQGRARAVPDPEELAALLNRQMDHFEPDRVGPPVATDNVYGKSLNAIQGVRFEVESVRAKFKFGGNRTVEHQLEINAALLERGRGLDSEAAAIQRNRLDQTRQAAD